MLFSNYSTDSNKTITVVLFKIFLIFTIYFNSIVQAHAAKNYNVKTIYYDPLEKVINATILDQIAEKTMQKSAKVPVTASATGSTVASMIRLGVAGVAIYGLIQGVGWIIENGVVKKPVSGSINNEQAGYYTGTGYYKTLDLACKSHFNDRLKNGYTYATFPSNGACVLLDPNGREIEGTNFKWQQNPNYIPTTDYKPVTDTELGDEVNNSPQAPQILPDVYNPNNPHGGTAPQITADALDNATPKPETEPTGSSNEKPNVDTDGDGIPDKYDPTKPSLGKEFTLPEFCSWATTMCEWYKKYKEDSKQAEAQRESEKVAWQREEIARQQEESQREKERSFWQKIEDFGGSIRDYFKDDEKPDKDNEVDIDDQPEQVDKVTVSIGDNICPSMPVSIHIPFGSVETDISPTYLCEIAQGMKAFFIALGMYTASLIVGRRT
ncbi:MAG: virulence factor TspB C-terminal domain-related protein [Pseudomonadota bacterium]|uniref:virulence factor TspB C-terminal domain-related protein n=1 Tax=Acinetobacter bereziniae TaxID=106648 RepID=UPI001250582E|nr:virulence factor TspB C-terminal domain-related protein [Acinetobacter bereziniae]MEC8125043.1 virulence factor TspB C-terminal domain-related protein [Pseudomonadota bacterium]